MVLVDESGQGSVLRAVPFVRDCMACVTERGECRAGGARAVDGQGPVGDLHRRRPDAAGLDQSAGDILARDEGPLGADLIPAGDHQQIGKV